MILDTTAHIIHNNKHIKSLSMVVLLPFYGTHVCLPPVLLSLVSFNCCYFGARSLSTWFMILHDGQSTLIKPHATDPPCYIHAHTREFIIIPTHLLLNAGSFFLHDALHFGEMKSPLALGFRTVAGGGMGLGNYSKRHALARRGRKKQIKSPSETRFRPFSLRPFWYVGPRRRVDGKLKVAPSARGMILVAPKTSWTGGGGMMPPVPVRNLLLMRDINVFDERSVASSPESIQFTTSIYMYAREKQNSTNNSINSNSGATTKRTTKKRHQRQQKQKQKTKTNNDEQKTQGMTKAIYSNQQ